MENCGGFARPPTRTPEPELEPWTEEDLADFAHWDDECEKLPPDPEEVAEWKRQLPKWLDSWKPELDSEVWEYLYQQPPNRKTLDWKICRVAYFLSHYTRLATEFPGPEWSRNQYLLINLSRLYCRLLHQLVTDYDQARRNYHPDSLQCPSWPDFPEGEYRELPDYAKPK